MKSPTAYQIGSSGKRRYRPTPKAHGGKALAIPFVEGYSTNALVAKIKAGA